MAKHRPAVAVVGRSRAYALTSLRPHELIIAVLVLPEFATKWR